MASHKYRTPDEVLYDTGLSQPQKRAILKRWKAGMDHRITPHESDQPPSNASLRKEDIDEALQLLEDPDHHYGLSKRNTRH